MYEDNIDYVAMRLNGTVVRWKKELLYVNNIEWRGEYLYADGSVVSKEEAGGMEEAGTRLDNLDLSSPVLGNTNLGGGAVYLHRQPMRNDWRQGLRRENLVIMAGGVLKPFGNIQLYALYQPIFNIYDSFANCHKRISAQRKKRVSIAFSRVFSIDKELNLWYKSREIVGSCGKGFPVLGRRYTWLKEVLDYDVE